MASVHKWKQWFRRDICNEAKLRHADLKHWIGSVPHFGEHCKQVFGPDRKWISRSEDWMEPTETGKIFRSVSWDLVRHHSLSGQTRRRQDVRFMCERLVRVLGLLCCSLYPTTLYRFRVKTAQVAKTNELRINNVISCIFIFIDFG